MVRLKCCSLGLAYLLLVTAVLAQDKNNLPPCSTQKVNGDCFLEFDRLDPVSLPTIQMRDKARISVSVSSPLAYETLTLDPQSQQAVAPADQTQGFVAAVLPSLKNPNPAVVSAHSAALLSLQAVDSAAVKQVKSDLSNLTDYLDNASATINQFVADSKSAYAQLAEAAAPLPRPIPSSLSAKRSPLVPAITPWPWSSHYQDWAALLTCELSAAECTDSVKPPFTDLMSRGLCLQAVLTDPASGVLKPPSICAPSLTFYKATFDSLAQKTSGEINALQPGDHPEIYAAILVKLANREASVLAWLPGVTAISKDLQSYFVNIEETVSAISTCTTELGYISDPRSLSPRAPILTKLLGRMVTYSINSVNQIAVATTAVPATSQKTSIITITVLFADPIFEVSTGVLFSDLPNRTFANQTLVNTNTGGIPTTGDVVITQSLVRPVVVPYVGANFRLGHDYLLGNRRSATYLTAAVGFNGYNTTAEYAVGPSFSWRMIMLSPLFHIGHDIHLTQGERVGEIWCTTAAAAGSPTACAGSPPSPSSKSFWRGGFALGIGIRVPTAFGTTTGH